MTEHILDSLMITLPLMKQILGLDMQIALFDREKIIGVWYGDTFRMRMNLGDYLDPSAPGHDMILKARDTGIGNSGILPEFVCGVAVDGIVTPVFEGGNVVGVISTAVSLKERKEIEQAAEALNSNLNGSQVIVKELAEGTSSLAQKLESMRKLTGGIEYLISQSSEIVRQIQQNAYKSNLLSLNASIEAARAGAINNGFDVVAKEMGKLSKASEESTKRISQLLSETFHQINQIILEISDAADISIEQAASMEEITANLTEITYSANKLEEIATVK